VLSAKNIICVRKPFFPLDASKHFRFGKRSSLSGAEEGRRVAKYTFWINLHNTSGSVQEPTPQFTGVLDQFEHALEKGNVQPKI
jgi:hypothetical protein